MSLERYIRQRPVLHRLLAGPRAVRRGWIKSRQLQATRASDKIFQNLATLAEDDIFMRIPEFQGTFALSPQSDLFRRVVSEGSYEPELASLYAQHIDPERDIIDVGANVGFFTVFGAKQLSKGRVLAVEPTTGAYARLNRNIERNGVSEKVIAHKGLASDTDGEATINAVAGREEYASIGELVHPSIREQAASSATCETVPVSRLDDLVARHDLRPALMKVDVEGAEARVFAGAQEVLAKHRPVVISELSNFLLRRMDTHGGEVVRMFQDLGYTVVDPTDGAPPGSKDFGEILCIPR